jgi:hypothetical protein
VPVPFDIGTYSPHTIDDLAVHVWIPSIFVTENVRSLDQNRHYLPFFPSLDCPLEHTFSVFNADPLFSQPNRFVASRMPYNHSLELRGDLLVVKHLKGSDTVVTDMCPEDVALVDLLVAW